MINDINFSWSDLPDPIDESDVSKAPYADCANCPLLAAPFVPSCLPPGSTPQDIELIVIGEAPGYYETQKGEPFVGPSGDLLYAVLDHIGVSPNVVWKTNAVLCRPPSNDLTKYQGAVKACSKRLQAELSAIPCQTIAALGNTAVGALDALTGYVNKDGILKRRGQWYNLDLHTRHNEQDPIDPNLLKAYLATLHPAHILRNTGLISTFIQDMRSILVERDDRWDHIIPIVLTPENRSSFLIELGIAVEEKRVVAFDVETPNLTSTHLLALGLSWLDDEAWIVPGDLIRSDPDLREILRRFFDRARLVAHNGKFDQRVLAANDLGRFNLEADTMLLHYMLDEQKGTHGLKQLLSTFVGVPDYEAELVDKHFRSEKRESKDYSQIPLEDLYQYLALDCCGTLALHNLLAPMVRADDLKEAPAIAINASNALQYTEAWGIKVDREYLKTVLVALDKEITQAVTAIQSEASTYAQQWIHTIPENWSNPAPTWLKGTKKYNPRQQYQQVVYKIVDGVSLGSWQQMQVLLYDVLGLKHTKPLGFKTDARSTNQEALDALEDHPFVTILLAHRRLAKIKGTYVEKLLELADENDRVHINYNIHGTETGRLSANDGLHGIPRPSDRWGQAVRGSFIAEQGHKLILADYSQAELRIFAAESKEPFLLNAYNNDEDVHGNTTKILFPNDTVVQYAIYNFTKGKWYWSDEALTHIAAEYDITIEAAKQLAEDRWKELRTTAKNVNFGGLVYLGGASGVAAMIRAQTGRDISEAQLKPILAAMLANIPTAQRWQHNQFRAARDQGFVQSRFGNKRRFMLVTDDNLDEIKKASVNAPIQNGASQLTLCSGIELTKKGYRVLMYNHDALCIEVREDLADHAAQVVNETMVAMGVKYYPEVKWKVDVDIADRWYENPPTFTTED